MEFPYRLFDLGTNKYNFFQFYKLFHKNDQQNIQENIEKLKLGEIKDFQKESRFLNKNGEYVWINFKCYRIYDNSNKLDKITGTVININT